MAKGEQIQFFPGEKRLIYQVDGRTVLEIEAWGGPRRRLPPGPGEPFGAEPTAPGEFVIWEAGPYVTRTWPWSRIRWGTRIRPSTDPEDVLYEADTGKWRSVRGLTGIRRAEIADQHRVLYGEPTIPETWVFNDFGPTAIRYFKDRNHDGYLDGNERLSGEMFHTTPDNEAEERRYRAAHPDEIGDPPVRMTRSHGCIHLRPAQLARMMRVGGFRRGMRLIIHSYDERFSE